MAKDKICKNCKKRIEKKCIVTGEFTPRKKSCEKFDSK